MSNPFISIVEVGPRDGLQNEFAIMPVPLRVQMINLLSFCGFAEIEVGSFVSPKWVPQMANTELVYQKINKNPATRYSALVPNEQGMTDALAVDLKHISVFTAASETFTQKNINCSIAESFERFVPVMRLANENGIRVRGYISCAITCPFEGPIAPQAVAEVATQLDKLGCAEISLGDTIGHGRPETIADMIQEVTQKVPIEKLAIHCHDTFGNAIENVLEALQKGIRVVDASIHGLGGCPYAGKKAKGNVATEKVVSALHQAGYRTGMQEADLKQAWEFVDRWTKVKEVQE